MALSQQNIKYVGKNQGIIKAISNKNKFPFAKNEILNTKLYSITT